MLVEREREGAGDGVTREGKRWSHDIWRRRGVARGKRVSDRVREWRQARASFLFIYCGVEVGPRWAEIVWGGLGHINGGRPFIKVRLRKWGYFLMRAFYKAHHH
jgi:hypothetical protein